MPDIYVLSKTKRSTISTPKQGEGYPHRFHNEVPQRPLLMALKTKICSKSGWTTSTSLGSYIPVTKDAADKRCRYEKNFGRFSIAEKVLLLLWD